MTVPNGQRWEDWDPVATFEQKVRRAVKYFKDKKSLEFVAVYVHPQANLPDTVEGLDVVQDKSILPGHFHFVTAENMR